MIWTPFLSQLPGSKTVRKPFTQVNPSTGCQVKVITSAFILALSYMQIQTLQIGFTIQITFPRRVAERNDPETVCNYVNISPHGFVSEKV